MLVDIHAHLFMLKKESLEKTMQSKTMILNTGLDFKTNAEVLKLSGKTIYRSLGGHPSSADKIDIDKIIQQLEEHKGEFHAVGEIGLDRYYKTDFIIQKKLLKHFLEFASKNNLPVVLHSRKAEEELLEIIGSYNLRILLHSFGGSKRLVKIGAERDYYFGIPSIVFKSTHHQMIVREVGIDRLITETDSPWQPPVIGNENVPMTARLSIEKIAEIKGVPNAEKKIESNFRKFLSV